VKEQLEYIFARIEELHEQTSDRLTNTSRILAELDPKRVLTRGYAIIRGELAVGSEIEIEKHDKVITAEVRHVTDK
jgi:exonuclease VII large subunit